MRENAAIDALRAERGCGEGCAGCGNVLLRVLLVRRAASAARAASRDAADAATAARAAAAGAAIDLSNLHEGIEIFSANPVTRLVQVTGINAQGVRDSIDIISPSDRYAPSAGGASFPLAYLGGSRLHPCPGAGSPWTHDSILRSGWSFVQSVIIEFIHQIPDVTLDDEADVGVHVQFHRPAVLQVAAEIFGRVDLRADFSYERLHLRGQAGRGVAPTQHAFRDVI